MRTRIGIVLSVTLLVFVQEVLSQESATGVVRQPVVAGQFYPGNAAELRSMLSDLFTHAVPLKAERRIGAIIAPHAGYVYSGGVAASAYNQIDPKKVYETVFVIGPSHRVGFEGAAVYTIGDFLTPFGTVHINTTIGKDLIRASKAFVARTDAHQFEHSIEVQLPFLQYRLAKGFKVVPIVVGAGSRSTIREIARVLKPYMGEPNLFVISTDFSHYPPYDDAVKVDRSTAEAIVSRSPENLLKVTQANEQRGISNLGTSLCGLSCVMTLLEMIRELPDISVQVVDYRNSGDAPVGDKSQVVGYYAIVASYSREQKKESFALSEKEKNNLLAIARMTIEEHVRKTSQSSVDKSMLTTSLQTPCGAFVTIRKNGQLRGCIGRFDASDPLYAVVQKMAIAASSEDYRFPPVSAQELGQIEVEVSVLTPMRRIKSIDEFILGTHGIYIKKGSRAGTFLPQVAEETGWSKEEFIGHCAQDKAGIGWEGWKDAELYVYEAIVFGEKTVHPRK